jgi:hypothetical protein
MADDVPGKIPDMTQVPLGEIPDGTAVTIVFPGVPQVKVAAFQSSI